MFVLAMQLVHGRSYLQNVIFSCLCVTSFYSIIIRVSILAGSLCAGALKPQISATSLGCGIPISTAELGSIAQCHNHHNLLLDAAHWKPTAARRNKEVSQKTAAAEVAYFEGIV